jgi:hypothetical protein
MAEEQLEAMDNYCLYHQSIGLSDAVYCFKTPTNIVTLLCRNLELLTNGIYTIILDYNMGHACLRIAAMFPLLDDYETDMSSHLHVGTCGTARAQQYHRLFT